MPLIWSKKKGFKIICCAVICSTALSFILPSECLAGGRTRGVGGESAEMDWGSIGMSIGITVGAALATSALSSAWRAATPAVSSTPVSQAEKIGSLNNFYGVGNVPTQNLQALDKLATTGTTINELPAVTGIGKVTKTLGNLVTNTAGAGKAVKPLSAAVNSFSSWGQVAKTAVKGYAVYTAATQTSRAMAAAGNYYGWDRNTIFLGSSLATGAVAGYLNPSGALGDTLSKSSFEYAPASMGRGMFVGALGGLGRGGVILGIDGDKIEQGQNPGIGAELAGTAGGIFATELGRVMVDPNTYQSQMAKWQHTTQGGSEGYKYKDKFISDRQLKQGTGADEAQKALDGKGITGKYGTDVTAADMAKLVDSDQAAYGQGTLRLGGEHPVDIPLTTEQLRFSEQLRFDGKDLYMPNVNLEYGTVQEAREFLYNYEGNNMPMSNADALQQARAYGYIFTSGEFGPVPTVQPEMITPSNGMVAGRIFLGPLVSTFNQWPLMIATPLAQMAAEKIDPNWKPLVYLPAQAFGTAALDSLATVYALKPSLWGNPDKNIDVKLGYVPEDMLRRKEVLVQAADARINTKVAHQDNLDKLSLPPKILDQFKDRVSAAAWVDRRKLDNLTLEQIESNYGEYLGNDSQLFNDLELLKGTQSGRPYMPQGLNLDQPQKQEAYDRAFKRVLSERDIALKAGDRFDAQGQLAANLKKEMNLGVGAGCAKCLGAAKMEDNKSGLEILQSVGGSRFGAFALSLKHSLQYELPVAVLSGLINVGFNQAIKGKNANDTMVYSLAAASATGIARGLAAHYYTKHLIKLEEESLKSGKFDPRLAPWHAPRDSADIVLARIKGDLPLPQIMSRSETLEYTLDGRAMTQDEVKAKFNSLAFDLKYDPFGAEPHIDMPTELSNPEQLSVDTMRRDIERARIYYEEQIAAVYGKDMLKDYVQNLKDTGIDQRIEELERIREVAKWVPGAIPGALQSPFENTDIKTNYTTRVKTEQGWQDISKIGSARARWSDRHEEYQGRLSDASKLSLDGKETEAYFRLIVPSATAAMLGGLNQSLFELGWQTMAMGLPHTKQGKMTAFAWNNYTDNLSGYISSAQSKGIFGAMQQRATDLLKGTETQSGIIQTNVIMALSNISLGVNKKTSEDITIGKYLGISNFVAVGGYKGMPYSEAAISEQGLRSATVQFYPYWPYYKLNPYPRDPFAQYLRFSRYQQAQTGAEVLPRSEENSLDDYKNRFKDKK